MRVLKQIIIGLVTLGALVFAAQNFETVEIVFLKWSVQLPIAVVVFAIYILGAFSGGMLWSLIKKVATLDQAKKREERQQESGQRDEFDVESGPRPPSRPKPGFFSDSDEQ